MLASTAEACSSKPDRSKPHRSAKPTRKTASGQPKVAVKLGSKPGASNVSRRFEKPRSPMQKACDDGAVVECKSRGVKYGGKASGKSGDKTGGKLSSKPYAAYEAKRGGATDKPKGGKNLVPAVGKPNSKKNKARRAAESVGRQVPRRSGS